MRRLLALLVLTLVVPASAVAGVKPYMDDPGDGQNWGMIWTCGWTADGWLCGTWWCDDGVCERMS